MRLSILVAQQGLIGMEIRQLLKQSLPMLLLCGLGEIYAGTILSQMSGVLEILPGLIILVPALIGMKGNIDTTLGSRLGSAIHMGIIGDGKLFSDEMRENIRAALVLSLSVSFIAGLLAGAMVGLMTYNAFKLVLIAVLAGTISGSVLVLLTVGIVMVTARRGLDPDNITGPALATIGDLITLVVLFTVTAAVCHFAG